MVTLNNGFNKIWDINTLGGQGAGKYVGSSIIEVIPHISQQECDRLSSLRLKKNLRINI